MLVWSLGPDQNQKKITFVLIILKNILLFDKTGVAFLLCLFKNTICLGLKPFIYKARESSLVTRRVSDDSISAETVDLWNSVVMFCRHGICHGRTDIVRVK